MTGGGGAPRIFHRQRRRGFMVGVGDVRLDETALKQRIGQAFFSGFTGGGSKLSVIIANRK